MYRYFASVAQSTITYNSNTVQAVEPYSGEGSYIGFSDDGGIAYLFGFDGSAYFLSISGSDNAGDAFELESGSVMFTPCASPPSTPPSTPASPQVVCTVVPGYQFFPNMDHSGDALIDENGYDVSASMGDVQYALGAFQAETRDFSLTPAGFTISTTLGSGSLQAVAKTSAIGTAANPVLNPPTPDVAAEFSGPCDGAYILISIPVMPVVCTVVPGYQFFPNLDHSGDALIDQNGYDVSASLGDVQYAVGAFQAETRDFSLTPAGFTVSTPPGGGSLQAFAKTSAIGTAANPVLNPPTPDVAAEFSGPCDGAYILISIPVMPVVCTVVPGYQFFPNLDHSGDALIDQNGYDVSASLGDAQDALLSFQFETHNYSLTPAGFTVSTPPGGGSLQAFAKTSAIGTATNPVLNPPTPDVAAEFSGPCDGAYILIPVAPVVMDFSPAPPSPITPAPVVTSHAFKFLGCFHDYTKPAPKMPKVMPLKGPKGHMRAFPNVTRLAKNSVKACMAVAMAADSAFFGMEAGVECWYGTPSTTLEGVTSQGRHPGACNVPCPGDKTHKSKCGAKGGAISVFAVTTTAA
ncbi:MAG: hypothetical protein WDW36_001449 [Sanguina aurantia]